MIDAIKKQLKFTLFKHLSGLMGMFSGELPVIQQKNFLFHYLDGSTFVFGMSFLSMQTVIPVFLKEFGGNEIQVGMLPVLAVLGYSLPQLFFQSKNKIGDVRHALLRFALLHRFMYLVLCVSIPVIYYTAPPVSWAWIFLLLFFIMSVISSFPSPSWNHFFARTVAVHLRGRNLAMRQFTGSLFGVGAGATVTFILHRFFFPLNYSILFFVTFLLMLLSYYFLSKIEYHPPAGGETLLKPGLRGAVKMVKGDRHFRNYLASDFIGQWVSTMSGFYAVYGISKFGLPGSSAGTFTMILLGGMLFSNVLCGYIADKYGHKMNIAGYYLSVAVSCVLAVLAPDYYTFGIIFITASFSLVVLGISRLAIILEMANEAKRQSYVAMFSTFSSPFVLSGLIQGIAIRFLGYEPVFIANAVIAVAGFIFVLLRVEEPRTKEPVL